MFFKLVEVFWVKTWFLQRPYFFLQVIFPELRTSLFSQEFRYSLEYFNLRGNCRYLTITLLTTRINAIIFPGEKQTPQRNTPVFQKNLEIFTRMPNFNQGLLSLSNRLWPTTFHYARQRATILTEHLILSACFCFQ